MTSIFDYRTLDQVLDLIADKMLVGDGCWEWVAAKTRGYGVIGMKLPTGSRNPRAPRVLYELLVGPISPGLELDHLCRNPGCVRPAHLEPVTTLVNQRRGIAARGSAAKHGTRSRYGGSWRCRCDACVDANRRYDREMYYRLKERRGAL
jgi:hypothetical protein